MSPGLPGFDIGTDCSEFVGFPAGIGRNLRQLAYPARGMSPRRAGALQCPRSIFETPNPLLRPSTPTRKPE